MNLLHDPFAEEMSSGSIADFDDMASSGGRRGGGEDGGEEDYANLMVAAFTAFRLLLGDFSAHTYIPDQTISLTTIIFAVTTFFIQIVLLNMLIALMNDTWATEKQQEEYHGLLGRAQLLVEYEARMNQEKLSDTDWFPAWLHAIKKGDDTAQQTEDSSAVEALAMEPSRGEIKARKVPPEKEALENIIELAKKLESMKKDLESKLDGLDTKVASIDDKVASKTHDGLDDKVASLDDKIEGTLKQLEKKFDDRFDVLRSTITDELNKTRQTMKEIPDSLQTPVPTPPSSTPTAEPPAAATQTSGRSSPSRSSFTLNPRKYGLPRVLSPRKSNDKQGSD